VYQVSSVPDYEIPISELEFKRPIGKVPSFRKLSFGGDFLCRAGKKNLYRDLGLVPPQHLGRGSSSCIILHDYQI
jgi:hypothetical protein